MEDRDVLEALRIDAENNGYTINNHRALEVFKTYELISFFSESSDGRDEIFLNRCDLSNIYMGIKFDAGEVLEYDFIQFITCKSDEFWIDCKDGEMLIAMLFKGYVVDE